MSKTEPYAPRRGGQAESVFTEHLQSGFLVYTHSDISEQARVSSSEDKQVLRMECVADGRRGYLIAKRLLDVVLASVALLLLFPAFVIIALMIYAEDRGPILFKQARVGKDGVEFPFLKFRSMVPNAEDLKGFLAGQNEATGPIFKIECDPRVTRVGRILRRYSLDELPQFISVLRGDMSLVGPRPHLPCEVVHYTDRQRRRLSVEPGLICLREVGGRSQLSFDRWIELDLVYIDCRSMKMDIQILLKALPAVLRGDGAY